MWCEQAPLQSCHTATVTALSGSDPHPAEPTHPRPGGRHRSGRYTVNGTKVPRPQRRRTKDEPREHTARCHRHRRGPTPAHPVPAPARLPQASQLAQDGFTLHVQVGSGVHGTSITGQDDRDELSIALEPAAHVTGLAGVPAADNPDKTISFEQYHRHTAWHRPGGLTNRSGAGDLDVVIYSARKWARLALAGNPTVLLLLYVPDAEVVHRSAAGAQFVDHAHRFVSRLPPTGSWATWTPSGPR